MVLLERTPPPSKQKRALITPGAHSNAESWQNDVHTLPASSSRADVVAAVPSIAVQTAVAPSNSEAFTWAPLGSQSSITPSKASSTARTAASAPAAGAEQERQQSSLMSARVPSLGAIAQMHQGRDEVDEWHVRSHNAWEEREKRPIGGSGGGTTAADGGAPAALRKDLPQADDTPRKGSIQPQEEQQDGSIIIHEEVMQTHLLAPRTQPAASLIAAVPTSQQASQRHQEASSAVTPVAPAPTFAKVTPSTASMSKAAPISTTIPRPVVAAGPAESATPKASTTPHRLDPATRIARIEAQEHLASLQRAIKDLTSKLHAAESKVASQKSALTSVAEERDGWTSEAQRLEEELDRSSREKLAYKTRAAEMSFRCAEQEWRLVTVSKEDKRKAQVQLVLCKNEVTYQQNRALELDDQLKYAAKRHDEVIKAIRTEAKAAVREERAKVKELKASLGTELSERQEELEKEMEKLKFALQKKSELADKRMSMIDDLQKQVSGLDRRRPSLQ